MIVLKIYINLYSSKTLTQYNKYFTLLPIKKFSRLLLHEPIEFSEICIND